jgi:hypothetical protein
VLVRTESLTGTVVVAASERTEWVDGLTARKGK